MKHLEGAKDNAPQEAEQFKLQAELLEKGETIKNANDNVALLGPKSWDPEVLVKLMKAGMNIIRYDMRGDLEEHIKKLARLGKAYEMAPEFKGKIRVRMRGPDPHGHLRGLQFHPLFREEGAQGWPEAEASDGLQREGQLDAGGHQLQAAAQGREAGAAHPGVHAWRTSERHRLQAE